MKVCVLGSGSKGNVSYIECGNTKLLIDCGLSYRQIQNRLKQRTLDIEQLDGVLITHEHTDHIGGLDVLLKKQDTMAYLTKDTYDSLYYKTKDNLNPVKVTKIDPQEGFNIKDIEIQPFSVSHDASDAVGYIIRAEGKKLVYVTDIGYLPKRDHELLKNADIYVFESNYDVTMLFTSARPFYLKQRIDSVKGHMSNTDSAYNMTQLIGDKTKRIILAHPSRECNEPELALETYREVFTDYGLDIEDYNVIVATQDIPTDVIEI